MLFRTPAKFVTLAALLAASFFGSSCGATDSRPRIAVASNFNTAAEEIAARFENKTGKRINLVFGSTGKIYSQIKNGAPYDLFLAADAVHSKLLEDEGNAVKNSHKTYAYGRLVLWGRDLKPGKDLLAKNEFKRLAVANPRLAPYGAAAIEVLNAAGVDPKSLGNRLVQGENVGQAFQFVKSGNADLGFVSSAQIIADESIPDSEVWNIPTGLYKPIEQQAVLLTSNETAREFLEFLSSPDALEVIRRYGYGTP